MANLNIHLHCLVLDGVYRRTDGEPVFVEVPTPTDEQLQALLHRIITRLKKMLARRGVLVEEEGGSSYLADADADADSDEARAFRSLQAAACTYRVARVDLVQRHITPIASLRAHAVVDDHTHRPGGDAGVVGAPRASTASAQDSLNDLLSQAGYQSPRWC